MYSCTQVAKLFLVAAIFRFCLPVSVSVLYNLHCTYGCTQKLFFTCTDTFAGMNNINEFYNVVAE